MVEVSPTATFLGLDLGTSGLRGLLVNSEGESLGDAVANYAVYQPQVSWSEQDPDDWITACRAILEELQTKYPESMNSLIGIGISGHMHGAVCLDDTGRPLRPCILWNDTRSSVQAARLDANLHFRRISGNIVFPGFTAPKLAWMADNEPELFARLAKVILPKDYLVLWLTGQYCTDMSDAAGTGWLNVSDRKWSDVLLRATGLEGNNMATVYEGSGIVGRVRTEIIQEFGLPSDVRVVAGGADNAAAACGIGAFAEGTGFVSLGTSGVLLAARDGYTPAAAQAIHTFCHAVPNRWYQMGVILSATDCLNWLANLLRLDVAELVALLPSAATGPCAVRFLPYLSGERTPHNESRPCGTFLGLSIRSDAAVLAHAVLDGVAFALRDCLEAIRSTGAQLTSLIAIGGGSKSSFWVDTLAQILGLPIQLPEKGDFGAALGAARLAMVGAGGMDENKVMTAPAIALTYQPQPALVEKYERAYQSYKAAYPAIRNLI